jgi:hypothetical protein
MIESPYEVGKAYVFRCVTYHYVGRVKQVFLREIVLENAAWIAETGGRECRWADFLEKGMAPSSEIEPYPEATGGMVILPLGGIVDASPWVHELPLPQNPPKENAGGEADGG